MGIVKFTVVKDPNGQTGEMEQAVAEQQKVQEPQLAAEKDCTEAELAVMEKCFLQTLMARDHLVYQESELLKAEYMEKLGMLEYKLYEYHVACQRLKRKLELIRQKLNCQDIVDVQKIDMQLEAEYAEYEEKLQKKMAEFTKLLKIDGVLEDDQAEKIKKLYKKLVKRLHPDLQPGQSEEEYRLFQRVVKAYKDSDLKTLRKVDLLTDKIGEQDKNVTVDRLSRFKELQKACEELKLEMEAVRKEFPFNQQKLLQNKKELKLRQSELQASLEEYKESYAKLERKIKELIG